MSVIKANRSSFALPKPGTHTLRITKVDDKVPGLISVWFEDESGIRFSQRYHTEGDYADIGTGLLTRLYEASTDDTTSDEFDTADMEGKSVLADIDIKEVASTKEPGEKKKYVHMKNIRPAGEDTAKDVTEANPEDIF